MKSLLTSPLVILCCFLSSPFSLAFYLSTPAYASASVPSSHHRENSDLNMADYEVPQLPEADPNANIPRINLGETIRFEEMGPIILNTDGTTRRIENWDQMTKKEQEVTWRRISKRNEERRKVLLEKLRQQEKAEAENIKGGEL